MKPIFFKTSADFRAWLEENHQKERELWVGYYKKATKLASITWPESVDEALCFGWIDGIRKSIDETSYVIRFTPRKPTSHWSDVNISRVKELKKNGLMQAAGLEAYKKRKKEKSGRASYEQKSVELSADYLKKIKANTKAWQYFDALAPSYKKMTIWFVMSAKREETRLKRLEVVISSSSQGLKIPALRYGKK